MIRLAITGIEDVTTRQMAVRLRQSSIVKSLAVRGLSVPKDVDAVALLGGESFNESLITECFAEKLHVLLAAPSIFTGDQLSRMSAVAATENVQFRVVNPDRYLPSRQLIHDQLIIGQLGAVGLIRSHRWDSQSSVYGTNQSVPIPLIRDLDLTSWLFGAVPEVIFAVESSQARTFIQVHLGFADGGMAIVDYSNRLPSGSGYQMLSVIGSTGVACADDHHNMQLHFTGGGPRALPSNERISGLTNMVQAFVDDVVKGTTCSSSVAEWQRALQLAEAVERSVKTHTSVSFKEH